MSSSRVRVQKIDYRRRVKLRRSLEDCRDILAAAQHIAVVGGSFIGLEAAASLRNRGHMLEAAASLRDRGHRVSWSPPRSSRWRASSDRSLPS